MEFELVYLINLIMFVVCFVSLGCTIFRYFKDEYAYDRVNSKSKRNKYLDYNIHFNESDYFTYAKYQMWRFYFPS